MVRSELLGHIDYWNEQREFGFIKTLNGDRFFCHNSAFRTDCDVNDAVQFDVLLNTSTGQRKAINVSPAKQIAPAKEPATVIKGPSTGERKASNVATAKEPAAVPKGPVSKEELRQARDGKFYSHVSFLTHYGRDGRGELMWQEAADKVKMSETDEASTHADSESIADDASCVSLIPVVKHDGQPVVKRKSQRQDVKAPQTPAKPQPQQLQQGFYRKNCNCCLLPGTHFADKCIGLQGQAEREEKRLQRAERELQGQAGFAEREENRRQRAEREATRQETRELDIRLARQREQLRTLRFL